VSHSLPFHSSQSNVFDNNVDCQDGQSIAPVDWRAGDGGGRRLCGVCAELNGEGALRSTSHGPEHGAVNGYSTPIIAGA
jgi:hypothetical protein